MDSSLNMMSWDEFLQAVADEQRLVKETATPNPPTVHSVTRRRDTHPRSHRLLRLSHGSLTPRLGDS